MENFEIKAEDISENSILFYVKREEFENKDLNIDDLKNVEPSEVQTVKREESEGEESEDECVDRQFETIFLPEHYEDIAVETPFFDFSLYKKRYGLPCEDDEINKADVMLTHLNGQIQSENVNIYNKHQTVMKNSCVNLNGNAQADVRIVPNSGNNVYHKQHNEIRGKYDYEQTPTNENMLQRENGFVQVSRQPSTKTKVITCINDISTDINRLQQDGQIRGQTEYVDKSECIHQNNNYRLLVDSQVVNVSSDIENFNSVFLNRVSDIKRHKRKSDDGVYKCSICKRLRVFDTLFAVNNHLKFEHLSSFGSKGGKLIEKIKYPKIKKYRCQQD